MLHMKTTVSLLLGVALLSSCTSQTSFTSNDNSNQESIAVNANQNESLPIEQYFYTLIGQLDEKVSYEHGVPEITSFIWKDKDNIERTYEVYGVKVFYPESNEAEQKIISILESLGFVQTYTSEGTSVASMSLQKENVGCTIQVQNAGLREASEQNREMTEAERSDALSTREYESTLMCGYVE